MFETVVTSVVDQLSGLCALSRRSKMAIVVALCGLFFILGLPFCLHVGLNQLSVIIDLLQVHLHLVKVPYTRTRYEYLQKVNNMV